MSSAAQNLPPHVDELRRPDAPTHQVDPLDTIGDLLTLAKGSIVETACHHTSDVPLRVNHLLIGWTEFEVVGDRLAVRITDQA